MLTVINELVEFEEIVSVYVNVDWLSIVVVFGSYVDADNSAGNSLLSSDVDGVFVLLVVKTFQLSLDVG